MSLALLDKAKDFLGSDYAVAKHINKTRPYIHKIRHGDRPMPDWMAWKLAELVGEDPMSALLENKINTAKDDDERAVWFQCADRVQRTSGNAAVVSDEKATTEKEKPAIKPARRRVGRRDCSAITGVSN